MFDDTSLVRMVIADIAKLNSWTFEEAIDKFYNSKTCSLLSDSRTGVFTFAPKDIVELFNEEIRNNRINIT